MFVYNCLGDVVRELKMKLSKGDGVELYNDDITRITGNNFKVLSVNDTINFEVNPDYIEVGHVQLPEKEKEAFYFELVIAGENYSETQKILYFEHENIDFFNKIILRGFFNTKYLCATREGTGQGNCLKSIIEYIYTEEQPNFYTNQGFKPKFNIISSKEVNGFDAAVEGSNLLNIHKDYFQYIYEKDHTIWGSGFWKDSTIYKIEYSSDIIEV